jgi:cobalt/nickel transport system permease protein
MSVQPWLWAVHISDSVLAPPWLAGGAVLAAALAAFGAWRVRDEEIPQIALFASAFFVASLIHANVGPTSVHLLLNGLLGVVLGRRACLAIPVGLFLQAVLIGHGGFSTIGVNSCVQAIPALLAGWLFAALRRLPWARKPWFRSGLVAACFALWTTCLIYCLALLATNPPGGSWSLRTAEANRITFHPALLCVVAALAVAGAWLERRMETAPEFPLGLLVGGPTVLLTLGLDAAVLFWGGQEDWHTLALLLLIAHLPVAVVEGLVLGFTVSFLARVKPDMIGGNTLEKAKCAAEVCA